MDVLARGIARESKFGYVKYGTAVMQQIAKDARPLADGKVDKVVWHFFKNACGKQGADQRILDALKKAGIHVVFE